MAESTNQTNMTPTQRAIHDAMCKANPDIEGDLMQKLMELGVDGPVRALQEAFNRGRTGRSRYVPGWRP